MSDSVDDPDLSPWIAKAICHFKVIGKSPVRVFEAKFRFDLVKSRPRPNHSAEPDLPEVPNYGKPDTLLSNPQMGRVYAPGEPFTVTPMLESLFFEPGDAEAIRHGEKFLCIYGLIRYRDAFSNSKRRETRFCYVCGKRSPLSHQETSFVVGGPPACNEVT